VQIPETIRNMIFAEWAIGDWFKFAVGSQLDQQQIQI